MKAFQLNANRPLANSTGYIANKSEHVRGGGEVLYNEVKVEWGGGGARVLPVQREAWGVLISVNFGCFSPSRFSHFHCSALRKVIKAHKKLHTNQQNEHTPGHGF